MPSNAAVKTLGVNARPARRCAAPAPPRLHHAGDQAWNVVSAAHAKRRKAAKHREVSANDGHRSRRTAQRDHVITRPRFGRAYERTVRVTCMVSNPGIAVAYGAPASYSPPIAVPDDFQFRSARRALGRADQLM